MSTFSLNFSADDFEENQPRNFEDDDFTFDDEDEETEFEADFEENEDFEGLDEDFEFEENDF